MPLNWLLLAHAVLTAGTAFLFAGPLREAGQVFYRPWYWLYTTLEKRYGEAEKVWWWYPLWGCVKCVAGQWCLWMYLAHTLLAGAPYHFYEHVYVVAVGILTALFLQKHLD